MKETSSLWLCLLTCSLLGAQTPPASHDLQTSSQVRSLQYKQENQDAELSYIKEKLAGFETVLETTHQEVSRLVTQARETVKNANGPMSAKVDVVEKNIEKLVKDLKAFKKQTNDLTNALADTEKKLHKLDEIASLQAQQIKDLEQAMRLLASAVQTKSGTTESSGIYQVKPGDTLDKIAKELKTTAAKIKAENNLQKDTIYPGQKLQIP